MAEETVAALQRPMTNWADEREFFPVLRDQAYFANPSLGAFHEDSIKALREYMCTWYDRPKSSYDWMDRYFRMHDTIAEMIGATDPDHPNPLFLAPSVSAVQATIASCFPEPVGQRNRILVSTDNFLSARYAWSGMVTRGFHVTEFDRVDLDSITSRVQLLVLPMVSPVTGELLDLEPVVHKAHAVGAIVMVDAFHGLGILSVDVRKIGADIVMGGLSKWVGCPSFGCCFGYVSKSVCYALRPPAPGWLGHETPFGFDPKWVPAPGAGKFRSGAPSIEPIYTAQAALDWIKRVGIEAIRIRSELLTATLHARAIEERLEVLSPAEPSQRGGMVVLRVPEPERIVAALAEKKIVVDTGIAPQVVRLGPHPTMTVTECSLAIRAIREVMNGTE